MIAHIRPTLILKIWKKFFFFYFVYFTAQKNADHAFGNSLPDITGCAALPVRPDVKYHVITNATYSCHNRDPVQAKLKHVTNIETCTLLCCDHIALWKALDANMVENGARYSDKNVKILDSKISMDRWIKVDEKTAVSNIIHVSYMKLIVCCVKVQNQKILMQSNIE